MGIQKSKDTNFVLQGMILASASILVRIIGLIYRIPLTNILGNDGNAFYSNAFEVYNIALLVSSYSIPLAVSKLVSVRMEKGEPGNAQKVLKTGVIFSGTVGLIVALLVFFGAEFLAANIMKMPMSTYALRVLAPCLFVVSILGVIRGYFQGMGTTLPTAVSQILEQILNAVVSVVAASYLFQFGMELAENQGGNELLPSAYGAAGGTLGTVAGATLALVVMLYTLFCYVRRNKKALTDFGTGTEEDYKVILPILIATIIPVVMSSAISNINTILDQGIYNNIMVGQGYTQGEYANLWGIFSGKYKVLMNVPLGVGSAMAAAFIPSITAAVYQKNRKVISGQITLALKCIMIIAMPSFIAFLLYSREILYLLFKDDTDTASNIMKLGCIGIIFISTSTITSAVLQGFNRMMIPVKNAMKALVVHMTCLLFMLSILKWNIYAVILADVIFAITLCTLNLRSMCKIAKYRIKWGQAVIMPFLAAVVMGVLSMIWHQVVSMIMGKTTSFLTTICVAVLIYLVMLFKFGILEEKDLNNLPGGKKLIGLLRKVRLI